jgi:chromosome partitioning protein
MASVGADGPAVTIAVANQKGGVGKTTSAVNIAASLASRVCPVLLIDLDPQGNASTNLNVPKGKPGQVTAYQIFQSQAADGQKPAPTSVSGLTILPAGMDLAGLDLELAPAADRATRLRRYIDTVRMDFRFIILDCPPSFGVLTLNALVAADLLLVPLQCEFLALEGLAHLKRTVDAVRTAYNPSLAMLGILLTMYDRRHNLSDLIARDVRSVFGDLVFDTVIPRNVRLTEAPSHGLPISQYDARSPGALAYERVTDEVLRRVQSPIHA